MDQDFVNCLISKPIAEIPKERLDRIQQWLIIVFKKIEYGVEQGMKEIGHPPLTKTQLEMLTSSIWRATFQVPIFEILDEKEIADQLLSQKIRPITSDDIFRFGDHQIKDS